MTAYQVRISSNTLPDGFEHGWQWMTTLSLWYHKQDNALEAVNRFMALGYDRRRYLISECDFDQHISVTTKYNPETQAWEHFETTSLFDNVHEGMLKFEDETV